MSQRESAEIFRPQSVPALVKNFEAMRDPHNNNVDIWADLDQIPPLFATEEHLSGYFAKAVVAWKYLFDINHVQQALISGDESAHKYLKNVRRFGLILKSAYKFFHAEHYAPQVLQDFVKMLGEHNDHFYHEKRLKYAQKILKSSLLSELEQETWTYQQATVESTRDYVNDIADHITQYAHQTTLELETYHRLRKKIRLLMNMMQIPASENLGSPEHHLFTVFYRMSKEMGDSHDEVVQATLGDKKAYIATVLDVPSVVPQMVDRALPFLFKTLGEDQAAT